MGFGFGCFALGIACALVVLPRASHADSHQTPVHHVPWASANVVLQQAPYASSRQTPTAFIPSGTPLRAKPAKASGSKKLSGVALRGSRLSGKVRLSGSRPKTGRTSIITKAKNADQDDGNDAIWLNLAEKFGYDAMDAVRANVHNDSVFAVQQPASSSDMLDVWSFNLRTEFQEKVDGVNGWSERREAVSDFIGTHRPALVCTQEATEPMLEFLAGRLENYAWAGTSRSPGEKDEMAGFLFDTRRLSLQKSWATWFGPADIEPGQLGWDALYPRTFETAIFQILGEHGTQGCLRVMNSHLDHEGVDARRHSAELLAEEVRKAAEGPWSGCAQILTGDFNSPKGGNNAEAYKVLTAEGTGLLDSLRVEPPSDVPLSTIHKFEGLEFEAKLGNGSVNLQDVGEDNDARHIDWVLWRDGVANKADGTAGKALVLKPVKSEVITGSLDNGRYPSDHFPVSVRFQLSSQSE
jgi:endonuclease/exonuclease/phosphatase family metal-dependent hydrolase